MIIPVAVGSAKPQVTRSSWCRTEPDSTCPTCAFFVLLYKTATNKWKSVQIRTARDQLAIVLNPGILVIKLVKLLMNKRKSEEEILEEIKDSTNIKVMIAMWICLQPMLE